MELKEIIPLLTSSGVEYDIRTKHFKDSSLDYEYILCHKEGKYFEVRVGLNDCYIFTMEWLDYSGEIRYGVNWAVSPMQLQYCFNYQLEHFLSQKK